MLHTHEQEALIMDGDAPIEANLSAAKHPHIWDPASFQKERSLKIQPAKWDPTDPVVTSRIQSRDHNSRQRSLSFPARMFQTWVTINS
jgi:hypothetical protein